MRRLPSQDDDGKGGGLSLVNRRRVLWAAAGVLVLALVAFFIVATRAPLPDYKFLSKYPLAARGSMNDGRPYVIVKATYSTVNSEVQTEFAGKTRMMAASSSTTMENGVTLTKGSTSYGLPDGEVTVSTVEPDPSLPPLSADVSAHPDEYCFVVLTRPQTLLDRMMDWCKGIFGVKKPQQSTPSLMPTPRGRQGYI